MWPFKKRNPSKEVTVDFCYIDHDQYFDMIEAYVRSKKLFTENDLEEASFLRAQTFHQPDFRVKVSLVKRYQDQQPTKEESYEQ